MSWIKPLALGVALGICLAVPARALDQIVEKHSFTLPAYTTLAGKTVKAMRVGYETYGRLNGARDNVILVTHFYSGTSHAAGKYDAADPQPGYWDAIIGPGKPIDTDRFFVVASDTPLNLNTGDPRVTTTGPASINPDTGKPWGMDFPVLAIGDFVRVQKALLDHLGVTHLHAVAGASMGSMQALEWAAAYPQAVDRIVAVIPPGLEFDAFQIAKLGLWGAPILADPRWRDGHYADDQPPTQGLGLALAMVTLDAVHNGWTNPRFGRAPAAAERPPAAAIGNRYAAETGILDGGAARATKMDARHFVYLARANQLFSIVDRIDAIRARLLLVPASSDLLFPPTLARQAADTLRAHGKDARVVEIPGSGGHLDGVSHIGEVAPAIADFLR